MLNAFRHQGQNHIGCVDNRPNRIHLAAAELSNTTPVDMPSCHEPEANAATVTLWVDGQSISYMGLCPPQGVLELHDATNVLTEHILDCMEYELDMLESVEPGCRPY